MRGPASTFFPRRRTSAAPEWRVAKPAPGLVDRRVEITGPTDRKMAINALNSGAKVWLADFEDANAPFWANLIEGQLNLRDALDRKIDFVAADGRSYELGDEPATIVARPRGWHLPEKHLLVDDEPTAGALFDFGLYFFHSRASPARRRGRPLLLPAENREPSRGASLERCIRPRRGALRHGHGNDPGHGADRDDHRRLRDGRDPLRVRDHSSGLNAGRWDYLFSLIKKFRSRGAQFVLPDRNSVTMAAPFMRAYTELLVQTCHRRGAHAIGGMAAFIPSRRDAEVNAIAMAKVREDKEARLLAGFDGSWVAHPDLVPLCREVFDAVLGGNPHQIDNRRADVTVTAAELLDVASTPAPSPRTACATT